MGVRFTGRAEQFFEVNTTNPKTPTLVKPIMHKPMTERFGTVPLPIATDRQDRSNKKRLTYSSDHSD